VREATDRKVTGATIRPARRNAAEISLSGLRTSHGRPASASSASDTRYGVVPWATWKAPSAVSLRPPQEALKYAAMGAAP